MSLYKAQKAPRDTQLLDQLHQDVRRLEASASALRLRIDTQICSLEAVEARMQDMEARVSAVEVRERGMKGRLAELMLMDARAEASVHRRNNNFSPAT